MILWCEGLLWRLVLLTTLYKLSALLCYYNVAISLQLKLHVGHENCRHLSVVDFSYEMPVAATQLRTLVASCHRYLRMWGDTVDVDCWFYTFSDVAHMDESVLAKWALWLTTDFHASMTPDLQWKRSRGQFYHNWLSHNRNDAVLFWGHERSPWSSTMVSDYAPVMDDILVLWLWWLLLWYLLLSQTYPGNRRDRTWVSGAVTWTQPQDQLCEGTIIQGCTVMSRC